MIIEKLIIYDYRNEEANSFEFSKGANIICSDDSTNGKSSIIKSLYYTLGLDLNKFAPTWQYKEMIFKLYYEHNGDKGYIIRSDDKFWVKDSNEVLHSKDYSKWLLNLLQINIRLPYKNNNEKHDVYASVPLSLYYIDQDTSWSGSLYKNTVNLSWYKGIPKNIFEYILGINNDKLTELEDNKTNIRSDKTVLDNQVKVLHDLADNFINHSCNSSIFDEKLIKQEISEYLRHAQSLGEKIKAYKSDIYNLQIQLDAMLMDKSEMDAILVYSEKSYKNINHKCTQCNSILTVEQSIQRMKLDSNIVSVKMRTFDLASKIKELNDDIQTKISNNIGLENEYVSLLTIAESKQGELTLQQYIDDMAAETSKIHYCRIQNDLSTRINIKEQEIKEIDKEIRKIKKTLKHRNEEIKKSFDQKLLEISIKFPKAQLSNYKFLEFKEIKDSGAANNQVFLCLYMVYTNILFSYSNVKLPFGLDSIIKDELDNTIIEKIYPLIEDTILKSTEQSFVVMLADKLHYIKNVNYNTIRLAKNERVLSKAKFNELTAEFDILSKKSTTPSNNP